MEKSARLNEGDIKLAIEYWMYNTKNATVKSGQDISFTVNKGDRPGDTSTISATVGFHDSVKTDESM